MSMGKGGKSAPCQEQRQEAVTELQKVVRQHEAARRGLAELGAAWEAQQSQLMQQAADLNRQLQLKDLVIQQLVDGRQLQAVRTSSMSMTGISCSS